MTSLTKVCAFICLSMLAACTPVPDDKAAPKASWSGPPLPEHVLTLELTPEARTLLEARALKLRVMIVYYGLPNAASVSKANKRNELPMGNTNVFVPLTTTTVRFQGEGLDPTLFPDTADGKIHFKASANGATQSNFMSDVLACSTARGTLTDPQTVPRVILCDIPRP